MGISSWVYSMETLTLHKHINHNTIIIIILQLTHWAKVVSHKAFLRKYYTFCIQNVHTLYFGKEPLRVVDIARKHPVCIQNFRHELVHYSRFLLYKMLRTIEK